MAAATLDETEQILDQLRHTVKDLSEYEVYRERFKAAGVPSDDIESIADFRCVETMNATDLAKDVKSTPPYGSLVNPDKVNRCNLTPNPNFENRMPIPTTNADVKRTNERLAEAYRSAGVTDNDVVLNTAGMMPYPFGWAIAGSVETLGATHIPMGPGDAEEQVDVIQDFDVTVISGFPSFSLELARTAEVVLDNVEVIIGGGEPFTAIEGYREEMREVFGGDVTVVDNYGLSEAGIVAFESREESGMHLFTDHVFPEVIDPETGELVDRGEKGELVVTTFRKEAMPLLRYRTGDITILEKRDSEYGDYILPRGVFGRVDGMKKIKGVKVYPDEIVMYLMGIDGVDHENAEVRITRPAGTTDYLTLVLPEESGNVNVETIQSDLANILNITIDDIQMIPEFESDTEGILIDNR